MFMAAITFVAVLMFTFLTVVMFSLVTVFATACLGMGGPPFEIS